MVDGAGRRRGGAGGDDDRTGGRGVRKGQNEMRLCKAAMIVAVQSYFDDRLFTTGRVPEVVDIAVRRKAGELTFIIKTGRPPDPKEADGHE
jgi:hypothetical protein